MATKTFRIHSKDGFLNAIDDTGKIVATTQTSLTDVPKLPKIGEDKEISVVLNPKGGSGPMYHTYRVKGFEDLEDARKFCEGHDHLQIVSEWIKTASKKQYSEEDMRNAFITGAEMANSFHKKIANNFGYNGNYDFNKWLPKYTNSLKPIPKEVELEMIRNCRLKLKEIQCTCSPEPKIDDKGFVIVKQWIWKMK